MPDIDWGKLKRFASPQGLKELDSFLDGLPLNAGYNAIIAAGLTWLIAGTAVFFTVMQIEKVSSIRAELAKVSSLKPPVPVIKYVPVPDAALKAVQDKLLKAYKGLNMTVAAGVITLSANDTDYFPQFLAAVSFLQSGGRNWRVKLETMCVGLDCPTSKLTATLKAEIARVGEPEPEVKPEEATDGATPPPASE
jgi:hypothetical protein